MEAFYFLGFIQAFRCLLAFQAALLSEGYSFLHPYPNFISYLYVSQPRVSQKPAIISTVQAPCFLFLILFYLRVCASVLTKLNQPRSLSSASLALRVEPLALVSPAQKKIQGPQSQRFERGKAQRWPARAAEKWGGGERQEKLSWDIQLGNCLFMPLSSSSLLHLWLVNAAQGNVALWRPQGATDLGMRLNICNKSWKWERNFSWSTVSSNAMIRALKLNGSTSLWLIQDML